jgi:hypothetical protein
VVIPHGDGAARTVLGAMVDEGAAAVCAGPSEGRGLCACALAKQAPSAEREMCCPWWAARCVERAGHEAGPGAVLSVTTPLDGRPLGRCGLLSRPFVAFCTPTMALRATSR